uniref:Uncharacterized protein n=1 Tax=Panagrolaimus sp. ES5 TaxID=591445 RepID=A0AC34GUC9_9BILA
MKKKIDLRMSNVSENNGLLNAQSMKNITELLKFSKDYKLQYKGICSIHIDTTKLSLVIQQNGEGLFIIYKLS